jgi:hypothetical protein
MQLSYTAGAIGSCLVYAEVLKLHGGPWLDCFQYKPLFRSRNRRHRADTSDRSRRQGLEGIVETSTKSSIIARARTRDQDLHQGERLKATMTPLHNLSQHVDSDVMKTEPAQCKWVQRISFCDVCRSAVCDNCAGCARDKRSAECRPCWEAFAPCLPSCVDGECYGA